MKKLLLITTLFLVINGVYSQSLKTLYSGGNNFSSILCADGRIFSAGYNSSGQLGLGFATSSIAGIYNSWNANPLLPTDITELNSRSGQHNLALGCSGVVYAWGGNGCGQLGRNNVVAATNCDGIGTGSAGSNAQVVVGIGGTGTLTGIIAVAGGNQNSLAVLTNTGYVVAWGANNASGGEEGMLGDGTTTNRSYPDYVLTAPATRLSNIIQVSAGDYNCYALDKFGNVWSWGTGTNSNALGRTYTGTGNRYAGLVQQCFPTSTNLSNIVKIAAGDRHMLALDANGNVWTIGGDWGEGQRGSGGGYNAQNCATKVVAPGCTGCDASQTSFNGPFLSNVADITGAQASSAAVLKDGRIVTWGSNGFFTDPSFAFVYAGSGCTGTNNYVPSGNSGNGSTANGNCGAIVGAGTGTPAGTGGNRVPVFVLSAAATTLTGMQSISGGDSWFFAQNSAGVIYGWGNNGLGTLGTGDLSDRNYATPLFFPPGCSVIVPCATKPSIGGNLTLCQPINQVLTNSNAVGGTTANIYRWEYRASTLSGWTFLTSGTGSAFNTYTATGVGQYRFSVLDRPGQVFSTLCGSCSTQMDTLNISTFPAPNFAAGPSTICSTNAGSGVFSITTSAGGGSYFWFTNVSGGSALNTVAGLSISGVDVTQTSTLSGCSGRVLYVQDLSSSIATMGPVNVAAISGCGSTSAEGGNRTPMMFQANQNFTLNSVDILQPSGTNNNAQTYRVDIYSNNPASGWNGSMNIGAPNAVIFTGTTVGFSENNGGIATVRTIPVNFSAIAGTKYWLQVAVSYNGVTTFQCTGSFPYYPLAPLASAGEITRGTRDGNPSTSYYGHAFRWVIQAGSPYACGRLAVCATATCPLSVSYADFYGVKNNNSIDLNWTTFIEQNASHFIVERSNDGLNFTPIGTLKAKGNSNGFVKYTFNDPKPGRGTVYYRLVQYDFDNSYYVSKVISINSTVLNEFTVVPNPNNGNFTVNANLNSATEFTLKVINSLGVTLSSSNEKTDGSFTKDFNLSTLAAGVYYISFKAGDDYIVKKVMIE